MALTFRTVKIPHRARTASGQAVRGAKLDLWNLDGLTQPSVWATPDSPLADDLDWPLFSAQDGTFPGYVHAGRYLVYIDDAGPTVWDAPGYGAAWRTIGETDAPAFQNGWVNYGSGYAAVAYSRDSYGIVRLRGAVKSGTVSTTIFTLPAGWRPSNGSTVRAQFPVPSTASTGNVQIDNTGAVLAPPANTFVPLTGITFLAGA